MAQVLDAKEVGVTIGKPCKPHASSAWIAPDGKFYFVNHCNHYDTALEIGDKTGGDELEDKGWLHCWSTGGFSTHKKPTQAQLDTLWDWMAAHAKQGNRNISQRIAEKLSENIGDD